MKSLAWDFPSFFHRLVNESSFMALKQIQISEVSLGMYITKLDVSWDRQPIYVSSHSAQISKQIDKLLKSGVKLVTIDTEKGSDVLPQRFS